MHNFPRPATPTVECARTPVEGACPECGYRMLARYRVMSEGGWWWVTKCQACLHSLCREPGPLLGAFEPLSAPEATLFGARAQGAEGRLLPEDTGPPA